MQSTFMTSRPPLKREAPQPAQMQAVIGSAETYLAPWRERLPNGDLGQEYGPPSPSAQARGVARHNNWAYKPAKLRSKVANESIGHQLSVFLRDHAAKVPEREMQVYVCIYEKGHSVRWTARHLKIKRDSVRVYIRRLVARLPQPSGPNETNA